VRWCRVTVALVVAAGLLGVACGSDGSELSTSGAATLREQVSAARAAVESGDAERGRTLLDQVEQTVASLEADDDISADRADEVRAALGDVREGIDTWVASTSTTTLPPTTTSPPTAPDDREPKKRPEPGKGREKGRD
jgi:hypothetical protein